MSALYLVASFLLQPEPTVPTSAPVEDPGVAAYEDARGVVVHLRKRAETVTLTSKLRPGWTFNFTVDGNQDKKWGYGSGMPDPKKRTSPDRKFGQDARNGIFCSQYVFTTFEDDPDQIQTSSQCGDLPSKGRAVLGGFDSSKQSTIALEIPTDEIFGDLPSAHVQVCVWDTARWSCEQDRTNLLVLTR